MVSRFFQQSPKYLLFVEGQGARIHKQDLNLLNKLKRVSPTGH